MCRNHHWKVKNIERKQFKENSLPGWIYIMLHQKLKKIWITELLQFLATQGQWKPATELSFPCFGSFSCSFSSVLCCCYARRGMGWLLFPVSGVHRGECWLPRQRLTPPEICPGILSKVLGRPWRRAWGERQGAARTLPRTSTLCIVSQLNLLETENVGTKED